VEKPALNLMLVTPSLTSADNDADHWWCTNHSLIQLRFHDPLDTKQVILETFLPSQSL